MEYRKCFALLLPGTKIRAAPGVAHQVERGAHHTWLHFGWDKAHCSNSSAGVSIGLANRVRRQDVTRILGAPAHLKGRGGTCDVCQGGLRMRFIVLYFAPRPGRAALLSSWHKGNVDLWEWGLEQLRTCPHRMQPWLFTDMNEKLGKETPTCLRHDSEVGRFQSGVEGKLGKKVHSDMLMANLSAFNTHWDAGFTYWGNDGARSRIDYWIGPVELEELIVRLRP